MLLVLSAAFAVAEEPVRVYTNADLAKFGPPSDPTVEPPRNDGEGWQFVIDFIERQHAQLKQQKDQELDRQLVEARVRELDRRSRRVGIALPYYYGYGYYGYRGYAVGHKSKGGVRAGHGPVARRSALSDLHRPIKPLHARRPLDRPKPLKYHRRRP
jgi:hypothetical protein